RARGDHPGAPVHRPLPGQRRAPRRLRAEPALRRVRRGGRRRRRGRLPPAPGRRLMFDLTDAPIDVDAVRRAVADPGCGAVLIFEGTARDSFEGRRVVRLEYEAWPALAVPVMTDIGDEITRRWPGARVAMVHRTGAVPIGEP